MSLPTGSRKPTWLVGGLLGLWGLGCAGFQPRAPLPVPQADPAGDPRSLVVPFYPDKTDQCGPAALASVLSFWGRGVDARTLKKEIYLAHLKGALAIDLLIAAQDRGFQAQLYEGDIEDLKTQVREGRPIIAFINRGTRMFPIGHYVVVTGYSESRRGLFVHSGDTPNRFVPTSRFLKQWEKTSRTTLRIDGPVP